jgi:hypothetical protein
LRQNGSEENKDTETPARAGRRSAILFVVAVAALALVAGFGWWQFGRRANGPIEIIKYHAIPGTDVTIGEGIENFVADKGLKVATQGFKPSWGAEETSKDVWVVSYVYEVGRQSHWISWKVYTKSGDVLPQGPLARELWGSK